MSMKKAQDRAAKLRSEIEEHRYRYYVLDNPSISDDAYDALFRELEQLEEQYPQLRDPNSPTQRVGAEPLEKFRSVPHSERILSLNDAFSREELKEWHERVTRLLGYNPEHHMDIKMDGLFAVLIYENGRLSLGLTRGDGYHGEDVTSNLRTIGSIPLMLRPGQDEYLYKSRVEIRGEVLIYKHDFQEINTKREQNGETLYANPRNLAAGSVRQLDPKLAAARPLMFHAHRVVTEQPLETLHEEYELAQKLGFIVNKQHATAPNFEEIWQYIEKWEERRFELPFQTDGIVITVNKNEDYEELGVASKAPRGAIAYKYPAEQATTTVKDIQVNVGRTGAVTPFAVLDPIQIAGTTVQMATLHNEGEIARKDIRIGDSVIVQKAGDIIPEVIQSLPKLRNGSEKKFLMPRKCPECGTPLTNELHSSGGKKASDSSSVDEHGESGAIWRCPNPDCPAQVHRRIEHFVSKNAFDIEGLGEQIVKTFLDAKLIDDPADLFTLKAGSLENLEGFGQKSAQNLVREIQAKKQIPLDRFIFALGIRHIGQETAFELARYFQDFETFQNAQVEQLQAVEGIGEVAAQSIAAWLSDPDNQALLHKLSEHGVEAAPVEESGDTSLSGQTFVITGTLESMSRDEAQAAIRERGGSVTSSVSSNTDYVVVGENPGSNKISQARQYGITQLNEEQLQQLLQD